MSALVLHPATKADLDNFHDSPSHALIINGPTGSGKLSIAKDLAETMMHLDADKFDTSAYTRIVSPAEKKSIGIDSIRELEHFLSLKVPGNQQIRRVIIIADAHLMTVEAQNSLLKTLEEPPEDTILILTVANEQFLLPTISSRAQRITVKAPIIADLEDLLRAQGIAAETISRTLAMSGGLAGLTIALAQDDDHPLRKAASKAREILGQSTFERLSQVDELSKQKELCTDTLFIMQQMAAIGLQKSGAPAAKRWRDILSKTYDAQSELANGAQTKLVLSKLLLSM